MVVFACGCQCRGWRDVCGVAGSIAGMVGPVRSSSCAGIAGMSCRREHTVRIPSRLDNMAGSGCSRTLRYFRTAC